MSPSSTGSLANTVVCSDAAPMVSVAPGICNVSHTVHDDMARLSAPRMLAGAPTMPTIGPRGTMFRNLSSTSLGLSFLPTINRAQARLSTGMHASPDADERRAAGLTQQNLRITHVGRGFEESHHAAATGDDDRDHQTYDQRTHLTPYGVVNHP
jgi:hypothetical protein